GLKDRRVKLIAEIVHEADLHDGKFTRDESTGVDLALRALAESTGDDHDLLERGMAIFDGLYTVLKGKERVMRFKTIDFVAVVLASLAVLGAPAAVSAAQPDWKAVEQALGKSGQLQAGDVFRIGMPRTDLSVTVKGVPVKAGFALGSYAAFRQVGDR